MEENSLKHILAQKLERSPEDISNLLAGFVSVMKAKCADMNDIAIPGFGTFVVTKKDEHIEIVPNSGKRVLYPPKVDLEFEPSVVLKSIISEKEK